MSHSSPYVSFSRMRLIFKSSLVVRLPKSSQALYLLKTKRRMTGTSLRRYYVKLTRSINRFCYTIFPVLRQVSLLLIFSPRHQLISLGIVRGDIFGTRVSMHFRGGRAVVAILPESKTLSYKACPLWLSLGYCCVAGCRIAWIGHPIFGHDFFEVIP